MEYGIRQLSELAGVSARTLRYYDEINLLKPIRVSDAGYRYYGTKELEMLQQILFYRERGFRLEQISDILYRKNFDTLTVLHEHLNELQVQRERMTKLITAVEKTIASMKGELVMSDREKFEAFKRDTVRKNEELYGEEIRIKYGEEEVDASNQKMMDMTEEEYERFQKLTKEVQEHLKEAVTAKESPQGEAARHIAKLHKEWLLMTWKQYSEEAHKGLVNMYVQDSRFTKYYDGEVPGCAEFLKNAVECFIEK